MMCFPARVCKQRTSPSHRLPTWKGGKRARARVCVCATRRTSTHKHTHACLSLCSIFLFSFSFFWGEIEMDCVAQYFIDINFTECCYSDTGDNYFTTDFFLSAFLPLPLPLHPPLLSLSLFSAFLRAPPSHSCRELVLHKLPRWNILNQSPATKGESVWLITKPPSARNNAHARRGGREGRWALWARSWHHCRKHGRKRRRRRKKRERGVDQPANLGRVKSSISHP